MKTLTPWLILQQANSAQLNQLACRFNSASSVLALSDSELREHGLKTEIIQSIRRPQQALITESLGWLEQSPQHHLLSFDDPNYPPLLKEIYSPPPVLYIKGDLELLQQPQLAIVGSRNPSGLGVELAKEFATALAQAGFAITSGLAIGIDAASHQACMSAGGRTLAVLGSGLAAIYPRSNQSLADKIVENGALISEHAPKVEPRAYHFPQRNRIISGLSLGTLVVEASVKSGSLITARLAAEQGREVFAIPGSPLHQLAAGCNRLIQQGAKLVNNASDLLEELGHFFQTKPIPDQPLDRIAHRLADPGLEDRHRKLLESMGFETSSIDQIALQSGFSIETTSSLLLDLELKGQISASPGGYIKLVFNGSRNQC